MASSTLFTDSDRLALIGLITFTVQSNGFQAVQTPHSRDALPPGIALGVLSMCTFYIKSTGFENQHDRETQKDASDRQAQRENLTVTLDHTPLDYFAESGNWALSAESQLDHNSRSKPSMPVEQLLYGTVLRSHSSRMLLEVFEQSTISEAYSEFSADALERYCHDDSNWKTFNSLDAQIALVRDSLHRDAVPTRPKKTPDIKTFLYQSQRRFVILVSFGIKKWNRSRTRKTWSQTITDDGIFQAAWQLSMWLRAIHAFRHNDSYCERHYNLLASARNTSTLAKQNSTPFELSPACNAFHHSLMASWGLAPDHEGACLLLSETWSESPRTIADRFDASIEVLMAKPITSKTLSRWAEAGGLDFGVRQAQGTALRSYSILRSYVNGAFEHRLDENEDPLDSGLDGSHLCHERLCVLHLVQEPKKYNLDRQNCHKQAITRRQNGEYVPSGCSGTRERHDPPCKLQLAALTKVERLCIQMNLLRQVRGLPALEITERPENFPFSKFVCTIEEASRILVRPGDTNTITANLLPHDPNAGAREMRSEQQVVKCHLCSVSYSNVKAYFRHVMHEHGGGITESRRMAALEELQRGAWEWLEKMSQATRSKGILVVEYLVRDNVTYEGFARYYEFVTNLRKGHTNGMHYSEVMIPPSYEFVRPELLSG